MGADEPGYWSDGTLLVTFGSRRGRAEEEEGYVERVSVPGPG